MTDGTVVLRMCQSMIALAGLLRPARFRGGGLTLVLPVRQPQPAAQRQAPASPPLVPRLTHEQTATS